MGPTSLSRAEVSHRIMDSTVKPDKPESSCARADSRPAVANEACYCENTLYSQL